MYKISHHLVSEYLWDCLKKRNRNNNYVERVCKNQFLKPLLYEGVY